MLTVNPNRRITAAEALQHDWVVSIGVHTNDLFSLGTTSGVPVMQARFGEFNLERRATARSPQAMLGLLGLPEDEEELLHSFTCSHADRTGQFILTPGHLAFLAYDHSAMFSQPITEVTSVCASTTIVTSAANDKSLILQMSNGKEVQLDGLWERDECIQLLQVATPLAPCYDTTLCRGRSPPSDSHPCPPLLPSTGLRAPPQASIASGRGGRGGSNPSHPAERAASRSRWRHITAAAAAATAAARAKCTPNTAAADGRSDGCGVGDLAAALC